MWGAALRRRLREACRIMVDNSSHTSPYRAEAWHPQISVSPSVNYNLRRWACFGTTRRSELHHGVEQLLKL